MKKKMLIPVLLGCFALTSIAQAGPNQRARTRWDRPHRQVEKRVRTMKIWKMTEEIDLTEEQATRFFPLLNEKEDKFDELEKTRRDILEKLGDIVWETKVNEKEVNKLIDQFEGLDAKKLEIREQFHRQAAEILTPAQMGKMVLFNHRFHSMMRDMVREFEVPDPPPPPDKPGSNW
jgi:Spy/CpxP family protein refolding chaperone